MVFRNINNTFASTEKEIRKKISTIVSITGLHDCIVMKTLNTNVLFVPQSFSPIQTEVAIQVAADALTPSSPGLMALKALIPN